MRYFLIFIILLTSLYSNEKLEKVTLQLQWLDQFQFAGYYVAKEKGFYKDAGLHVDIKSFKMGDSPVEEVLSGRAQYGTGRTSLLIDKSEGKGVYLLSAILQSSPLVLVTKKSSGIDKIEKFKGKKVLLTGTETSADIFGMTSSGGIKNSDMLVTKSGNKIKKLLSGEVDIISAYTSNQVNTLKKQGIDINIFNPKDYGFNFYSDLLFTGENEYKNHNQRAHDFNAASLKGWEYAFSNIEETVELIMEKYNSQNKTKSELTYEANELKKLAYYKTNQLGEITKEKIEKIYDIYRIMRFVKNEVDIDEFILDTDDNNLQLNDSEKKWIKKHPVLTYSEVDWKPLSIIENGKMNGIMGDFLDLISDKTGIKFKFIPSDSWTEVLRKFKDKEIDLVPSSPQEHDLGLVSDIYKEYPMVIVTNENYKYVASLEDLREKTLAIPKYYTSYNYVVKNYPYIKIKATKNIDEALYLVAQGDADAFVGHIATSLYHISDLQLSNLKVSGTTEFKFKHSYLIQRDNPELLSIINKVFSVITEQEKAKIYSRWADVKIEKEVDYTLLMQVLFVFLAIFLLISYRNLTLKRYSEKLEKQKKLYDVVFENSLNGVIIIDLDTYRFIDCNKRTLTLLEYTSKKEFLGLHPADISPKLQPDGRDSKEQAEKMIDIAKKHGSNIFEWKHKKSNDEVFWVEIVLSYIVIDGKNLIYAMWKDIDARKNMEVELRNKDEIMIAQSRHAAMGEMISMIAHQWRQPIATIAMGANNVILDIELDEVNEDSLRELADDILEQTEYLSNTIDDFRNFFRPNKDKDEVKVVEVLDEVVSIMGMSFENNNIKISINCEIDSTVLTHSRELLQVLINIFKNAKEALEEKEIEEKFINTSIEKVENDLIISICDNAGGIDDKIKEKIFDPYFSTKSEKTGTGLGLYMSKTIVEKHLLGTINMSNINNGACFTIKIPIK